MKSYNAFLGKCCRTVLLVAMGLLLAVAACGKKGPKKTGAYVHDETGTRPYVKKGPVKFDFKKTGVYFHGEIGTRPDFPASITFARDYVYTMAAIGEKLDGKSRARIIAFIRETQKTDGGFSMDERTRATNAVYTDYALETLSWMNALTAINAGKARSYLLSLKRRDGGFAFNPAQKASSLQTTYDAVHALSLINGLGIIDKTRTAAYVKGFQRGDTGGYNYVKGKGIPNVKNTFMAVYVLKAAGALDQAARLNAVRFLTATAFAGNRKKYIMTDTLEDQMYALRAMRLLGAGDKVNRGVVVEFIKTFYIPVNGGFGPVHGYGTSPDSTLWGIRCLTEAGVLRMPAESGIKSR